MKVLHKFMIRAVRPPTLSARVVQICPSMANNPLHPGEMWLSTYSRSDSSIPKAQSFHCSSRFAWLVSSEHPRLLYKMCVNSNVYNPFQFDPWCECVFFLILEFRRYVTSLEFSKLHFICCRLLNFRTRSLHARSFDKKLLLLFQIKSNNHGN